MTVRDITLHTHAKPVNQLYSGVEEKGCETDLDTSRETDKDNKLRGGETGAEGRAERAGRRTLSPAC